jgi:D-alanyl-D-alanine carboxypeptidase/D-alanyl-D-alanine-endopeptidase (penicillin-binding protein 4)
MTGVLKMHLLISAALVGLTVSACTDATAPVSASDPVAQPAPLPAGESRPSPERSDPDSNPAPSCKQRRRLHLPEGLARGLDRVIGAHSIGVAVGFRNQLLYGHDEGRRRVSASNQKLLLSMALLDALGPDHRIPTKAATPHVDRGVVKGNLWLVGAGDPTLSANSPGYWGGVAATTLDDLAADVARSGITEVRGRVMGERTYFAHDLSAPGWQPYVPGRFVQLPSALVVDGNNAGAPDPERAAAIALTRALRRFGVQVTERPGSGRPPKGLKKVAVVHSRPLAEIVSYMNRTSNNFFAEMLVKLLGAETFGPPGTIKKGARAITEWARKHGVAARANDGSGLSYANRVSPRGLVHLLGAAERKPWGEGLRRGLPGAGEGTLRSRLHGLDVRAKTGTLFNGASTLSGWVRSAQVQRWIRFSILGRNTPKTLEDRILQMLSAARVRSSATKC